MVFPNDDTGNVLAEIQAAGIDFNCEHAVIFFQLFEQEQQALAMAAHLQEKFPEMQFNIHADKETRNIWDLDCTVTMPLSYDGIVAQETEFELLAAKFEGYNDGWGMAAD